MTCRATRSYAEPMGPDNMCGEPVAGFALSIGREDVDRLLAGEEARGLYPIGYCKTHLRALEVAQADARKRGHGRDVAHLFAGSAAGVLWLEREQAAQAC